jgi:hypothetical protein
VIPDFASTGLLPAGIHPAAWSEFIARFGGSSRRTWLLEGLLTAVTMLRIAGCHVVYIDGSFVTAKADPDDYDGLWDATGVMAAKLDPILLDLSDLRAGRVKQKVKYRGEFIPVQAIEDKLGITFLEFFQICKASGVPKGIIRLELSTLP